jgi:hypothetical protein
MDCPNCGVYNPDERTVCWRCDHELPKPEPPKKRGRDPAQMMRRTWIVIVIAVALWFVITWLLPMLLGGGVVAPTPVP